VSAGAVDTQVAAVAEPEQGTLLSEDTLYNLTERYHYQLRFAVSGRVRFLSHLETVDILLGALRRAGVRLALSLGMRPKPLIKLAMPRPVGVEAWEDIVEVELVQPADPDAIAMALVGTLPDGLVLLGIVRIEGTYASAASRVLGATYRITVDGAAPEQLAQAVARFRTAEEALVERVTPKVRRTVDVRALVGDVAEVEGAPVVRAFLRLGETGSARPKELVQALAALAPEAERLTMRAVVRESITLAQAGEGGRTAEPELVGADVPDGPERPWGAC
jgi:radical SAM-linked protein